MKTSIKEFKEFKLSEIEISEIKKLESVEQVAAIREICKYENAKIYLALEQLGKAEMFPLQGLVILSDYDTVKDLLKGKFLTLKNPLGLPLIYTIVRKGKVDLVNENYSLNEILRNFDQPPGTDSSPLREICKKKKEKELNLTRFNGKECSRNLKFLKE